MKIKNIKFKKILYPVFLVAYFTAMVLVFVFVVNFIAKNINASFVVDESLVASREIRVDISEIEIIAKKLGIINLK